MAQDLKCRWFQYHDEHGVEYSIDLSAVVMVAVKHPEATLNVDNTALTRVGLTFSGGAPHILTGDPALEVLEQLKLD